MAETLRIALNGACGRMGIEIIKVVELFDGVEISFATDRPGHESIGADIGEIAGSGKKGVIVCDSLNSISGHVDAIIDFSLPAPAMLAFDTAANFGIPIVSGTTGFSDEENEIIKSHSAKIPLVRSSNMSVGMNLMAIIASEASKKLGDDYDIEIFEAHHKHKKDAPSGSALMLADALLESRGLDRQALEYDRSRLHGERKSDSIGLTAARGGDIVGLHKIFLAGPGEYLEFSHTATSRSAFARGAIRAAKWVKTQKPGLYNMKDVLGL